MASVCSGEYGLAFEETGRSSGEILFLNDFEFFGAFHRGFGFALYNWVGLETLLNSFWDEEIPKL